MRTNCSPVTDDLLEIGWLRTYRQTSLPPFLAGVGIDAQAMIQRRGEEQQTAQDRH